MLTLFSSLVGDEAYKGEVGSSGGGDGKAGEDGGRAVVGAIRVAKLANGEEGEVAVDREKEG